MRERREQEPRRVDVPEPGYFSITLVRGGPRVAAEIRQDGDGFWRAEIDGKIQQPVHTDPALAEGVFRVWHYGVRIDAQEHEFLLQRAEWARLHAPDSPEANPTRPINVGSEPPAF